MRIDTEELIMKYKDDLFRIAFHICQNKEDSDDAVQETLEFETPETKSIFYEVMKLPERYRMVIHLFYYEEYSIHEIAELLKLSESNVKVRLSRGRKLLKNIIQEVLP